MPRGDDVKKHPSHSGGYFSQSISNGSSPNERREGRRTKAITAARKAIGAETADQVKLIVARNPEKRALYRQVLDKMQ